MNLKERYNNKKVDLRKIQRIIDFNSITLYFTDNPISDGIWYYPSLFNHSCIPNCFYFGFGDVLIIIALNDIEPNSELFINYFNDDMIYDTRQKYTKKFYDFECNCELCKYEKNKFKNIKEKKILDEYLKKLNCNIFPEIPDCEKEIIFNDLLNHKEIEQMIKFIEKNKKIFSCYEMSNIYLKCAYCMRKYDSYLAYEYLEKSLKYSENRNYYYDNLSLIVMIRVAKELRSDVRLYFALNKFKEFLEKYYPNQKKYVEILMNEYLYGE